MGIKMEGRIHFLDSLRGFTLIHMVFFHLCYDLVFFMGVDMPWYRGWPGSLWGDCIRWSFILISGMVFLKGRHPFKRGAVLLGWGCVLTFVTWSVIPEALIRFGILSFLGAASVIGAVVSLYLKKIPAIYGAFGCAVLFAVTWPAQSGGLGFFGKVFVKMPGVFYRTKWLYWMGFPDKGFYSTDYFPVFPWIFLFFLGIYLAEVYRDSGISFDKIRCWKPGIMAFLGRYSLYIYLIHQPAIYGFCLLSSKYIG